MSSLLVVTLVGFAAGMVGTGTGGAMAITLRSPSKRLLSVLLSLSGGLMISVVCFDLLPEAFEVGNTSYGVTGILIGVFALIVMGELIPKPRNIKGGGKGMRYIKTGILMGVGIATHNFPEGLAIGSGYMATAKFGFGLTMVIALHNIPEGIAMATPMIIGGMARFKVFLYTILAGVPMGLGAFIGYLLGEISPVFISVCLGFAGGAMLYITCSELIPESHSLYRGRVSSLGIILGIIGGIILSAIF